MSWQTFPCAFPAIHLLISMNIRVLFFKICRELSSRSGLQFFKLHILLGVSALPRNFPLNPAPDTKLILKAA